MYELTFFSSVMFAVASVLRWNLSTQIGDSAATTAEVVLFGTAKDMVQKSTTSAVVAALSPICVDKFQRSAEATTNMTELKKVSSYMQGSFIEKGGWATLPGSDSANSSVAQACANLLGSLK